MSGVKKVLKSRIGVIFLSIVWALGLATLFRKACEGNSCTIVKYVVPNPKDISQSYYNYGTSECYQYEPIISKC